jgi:hypothetical protein
MRITAAWSLLAAGSMGAIAGCTTTQDTAARLQVKNERILAARKPVVVKRANPGVKVVRTTLVRDGRGAAVAVLLRNDGSKPVTDLPLSVGVRGAGGKVSELNRKASSYFQGHVGGLAPGAETTWVYTTKDKVNGSAAVARVGEAGKTAASVSGDLPKLEVSGRPDGNTVEVTVDNSSDVTQYDVAVYAAAKKGGRYVAAGQTSVVKIDPGTSTTVPVKLIGDAHGARVSVFAPPTIFE